ncbi:MAG: VTT domain-containing protein [Actinomycetota bacterium]|nr:VTT domain-containing protein [Actinomycetota bacterium]
MRGNSAGNKVLLWLAALRIALGVIAIPLAPFLYDDYFLVLVLLRPTKEVFLAGGFLARSGDVQIPLLVLAAIPLSILAVWIFYYLGRAYEHQIENERLPALAHRLLTPQRIKRFEAALEKRGPKLIFLGRLAVLSSAAVAAAAGAARLEPRRFLPVDLAGALVSIAYTVAAGYVLGEAYQHAGPWLSVVGFVALVAFAFILGRQLQKD